MSASPMVSLPSPHSRPFWHQNSGHSIDGAATLTTAARSAVEAEPPYEAEADAVREKTDRFATAPGSFSLPDETASPRVGRALAHVST
jgi:hypothetical protein